MFCWFYVFCESPFSFLLPKNFWNDFWEVRHTIATALPKQKHDALLGNLIIIVSLNFESAKALRFDSAINGIILAKL